MKLEIAPFRIGLRDSSFGPLDDTRPILAGWCAFADRDSSKMSGMEDPRRMSRSTIFWDKSCQDCDIVVFTDRHLWEAEAIPSRYKVAWLIEPPAVDPQIYSYIVGSYRKFDLVFTYAADLLRLDSRFALCPCGGTRIPLEERAIYEKSKLLSIVASAKSFAEGHRLRHEAVRRCVSQLDGVFGLGYQPIPTKTVGLADYCFSIAIENCRFDGYYFSEKIVDCFACGTVPIYWGCPRIGDFFDLDGVIVFDSVEELVSIVESLSPEDYLSRIEPVRRNFERVEEVEFFPENWMWEHGLEEMAEGRFESRREDSR